MSLRMLHVTVLPPPQLHGDSHGPPKWYMTLLHLPLWKSKGDLHPVQIQPYSSHWESWLPVRRMHPNSTFAVFLGEHLARRKVLQPRTVGPGFWSQLCLFWHIEHGASRLASRSSSFDIRRARVWTLWFIRSLLEQIDVSLYHMIQNVHLYFPVLNWFLLCDCCLVKPHIQSSGPLR